MAHLPNLITDLALILIVAGLTTIIFKWLKQPLVLGYIVAGFLTGPHFPLISTISDGVNVNTWAEIGIIFLLFALGLEFSLKKLTQVGHTAFITAITEVLAMLLVGYLVGQLLGWSVMDSVFLGGMLSMSSTTIIIKAFSDLGLKGQKFTDLVFGTLIVEDIAGIVMMVMMGTIAVSQGISQWGILASVLRLGFFLVIWFILGIFLIPYFFRRAQKSINNETLLIVSIGMCLGMVVLSNHIGFSSALGAFIAGSILSETREGERIEHLITPVKDLFGAVFFVSVGMMVDPAQLVQYAGPIFVIVLATIFGKLIFSTIGMLLSGESLKNSMQAGFSLAQIGEFAFIIAGLGQTLGVTRDFLYPIVVAVSVITTFTTPFFVGLALPAYHALYRLLPQGAVAFLQRYTAETGESGKKDRTWQIFLQDYFANLLTHSAVLTGITLAAFNYGYLIADYVPGIPGDILETILPLLCMAPFLRYLLFPASAHPEVAATLIFKKRSNRLPLMALLILRIALAVLFILLILFKFLPLHPLFLILIACAVTKFIYSSDWLMGQYLRIRASFLINLNERHLRAQKEAASEESGENKISWLDEELYVEFLIVTEASPVIGKSLKDLSFRERFGVNIMQIARKNGSSIDIPGGSVFLKETDSLVILGSPQQLNLFCAALAGENGSFRGIWPRRTLRRFLIEQEKHARNPFLCYAVLVDENSFFWGKSLKEANIRDTWHCMALGLERGPYSTINPHLSLIFEKKDILWLLGKSEMMAELIRQGLV